MMTTMTAATPSIGSHFSTSEIMVSAVEENVSNSTSPFEVPGASPILHDTETMCDTDTAQHTNAAPLWEFPDHIALPSTDLVQSIFKETIKVGGDLTDQNHLANYGVYSFRDVLLPAVCCQHNDALKSVQAVLQRDHPDRVGEIQSLRIALVQTTLLVQNAITKSANHRNDTIWPDLRRQREAAQKSAIQKKSQIQQLERLSQQREMKKKFSRNVDSWREVANLMTDLQKLKKEEKVWKQALTALDSRPVNPIQVEDGSAMDMDEDDDNDNSRSSEENCSTVRMMETFDEVQLSCKRLEQHLGIVENALTESEKLRTKVVEIHHREHFALSQSSAGSKSVFRILSQEDPLAC